MAPLQKCRGRIYAPLASGGYGIQPGRHEWHYQTGAVFDQGAINGAPTFL